MADELNESTEQVKVSPVQRGRRYQKRRARKPAVETASPKRPVETSKFTTDANLVEIWERRMLNPFGSPTTRIELKDKEWLCRWINTKVYPGRLQTAREQGYIPCTKTDLLDPKSLPDVTESPDGYVTRGDHGEEVLMKIPTVVYQRIQKRKVEILAADYASPKKFRDKLQHAAASKHGEETSEAIGLLKGNIKFGTERIALTESDFESAL